MDFDDKEQYPFLLLGKHHVLDDPLCKYSDICSKTQETHISDITKYARDNIGEINLFMKTYRDLKEIKDRIPFIY